MEASDYDRAWAVWGDMIRYSPAPFHRRRMIVELASRLAFSSVLDVGCGPGEVLRAIGERFDQARRAGVDLSAQVIAENRERWPEVEWFTLDIGERAIEERFDLVICSEVLEHVEDVRAAVANLRRMCRRDLIVTVPTGRVFPIDRRVGHVRHFTPTLLRAELEDAGFSVECVYRWGFPFHTLYKMAINLFPDACMDRFAGQSYGRRERWISAVLRTLFYCNFYDTSLGYQLVVHARAREQ